MFRTEINKDEIVVTRRTDGKTIAFRRDEFDADAKCARRAALKSAKACQDWNWG